MTHNVFRSVDVTPGDRFAAANISALVLYDEPKQTSAQRAVFFCDLIVGLTR